MKKLPILIMLVGFLSFMMIDSVLVDSPVKATSLMSDLHTTEAAIVASAQETDANNQSGTQVNQPMPSEKMKIEGEIIKREGDNFTLHTLAGSELMVQLSNSTKIEEKKSNPFRGARKYSSTDLLPGLHVEVEGRGNNSGALVAEEIEFRNDDLLVARSIQTQVAPVKNQLDETELNAKRLSGQMEELTEVANVARGGAKAAQEAADTAITRVQRTNERISSLDEYQVEDERIIHFKVGSAQLSPQAEALLDQIATEAKTASGFIIEVAGFASADGNEVLNRALSQKRSEVVIRYLVEEHEIPLRRILMPYGYGELFPMGNNSTREGRKQNRRVEVKLLVNRGLTEPTTASTAETGMGAPQ
jgi:outer membrane protein OmpA-like peptidoglycan-associated protein